MARPLRIEFPGAFYHVFSRGNEKRDIYSNNSDRRKFLSYLESATTRYGAAIHAYCLMPNHYHLLIETPSGNLSQIMRHINGAYTTYYNVRHDRVGHLFQGRYKAILVEGDRYAGAVSRYIHLNPCRSGLAERPEAHPWSSYPAYIGKAKGPEWLRTDFTLGLLSNDPSAARKRYKVFVSDGLEDLSHNPLEEAVGSAVLGGDDFVRDVTERFVKERGEDRNLPTARKLIARPTIDEVLAEVDKKMPGGGREARRLAIYLCCMHTGASLKEIGERFGISESAVAKTKKRGESKGIEGGKGKGGSELKAGS